MNIKARFTILYKSGHEDVIEQVATVEEIDKTNSETLRAFREDQIGALTFGDGKETGYFIRVEDVARLKFELLGIEGENK